MKSVAETVASAINNELTSQVVELRNIFEILEKTIIEKDNVISNLKDQMVDMQQYSRRNAVRIFGIPEKPGEQTDHIVLNLAYEI